MPVLESQFATQAVASPAMFFRGVHPTSVELYVTPARIAPETVPVANPAPLEHSSQSLIRAFDIAVSLVAILLFLPLMVLLYLLVKATSQGAGFFAQHRVGRDGELFPCLKFRSMVADANQQLEHILSESEEARQEWARDQKLREDPRVTPIGSFLRKTSLDELPQLFNVLVGHMSIVGPRPIIQAEIVRYGARFPAYCSVRPGLTGLWQVSGRNDVSYAKRVRLDALYVRRQSLAFNVAICLRTVPALLNVRGCY